MKSNLKIIIVSLTCSILSVLFYSIFSNNSTVKEENNSLAYNNDYFKSFVNTSGYNNNQSSSNLGSPDLTFSAKKSINAVVHVKNTSIVKENDSWALQFFYGDDSRKRVGTGSGVIISPDGYIITNHHVIDNSSEVIVTTNDNKEYEAIIVGSDEVTDVAVLKINSNEKFEYLLFGDSENSEIGQWVLAVGNPYNLNSTVTAGIISSKSRDLNEYDQINQSFIQTDAAVNIGNSGGALVNINGELIGINTAIQSMTGGFVGYSFAIPSNIVRKIFEDILEYGDVQKGLLGVRGVALKSSYSKQLNLTDTEGFYIDIIEPGFGADLAELKKGDIIKEIDGIKINKFSDLSGYLSTKRPGDKVNVTYSRENQLKRATVTLQKANN
ncbi:MAG TPA: trypsin-like peptidase domain-containing protein [Flavobacteriaceae bacterium]|jgi:S1-C subfamily serine protease|nr:serine protease [Flavobacteriaceae bacterium]MDP7184001.1 trypsin-like peptidase domain-containing protein [Flavobacteriaceae bacterium]HJO71056.1 trypsin-like peptidase domain-containing protein [Flavobacteriaceae bacterium]|tara:strand:+ start:17551 stop:18699 length:1149 start_codon:yes stop_codon:yes gene_type:complete